MPCLYILLCSYLYSFYRNLHLSSIFLYCLLLHFNSVYFSQHPDLLCFIYSCAYFFIFSYILTSLFFLSYFFNLYIYHLYIKFDTKYDLLDLVIYSKKDPKEFFWRIKTTKSCSIKNHNSISMKIILRIFKNNIKKENYFFYIYFIFSDLILVFNKCTILK